MINKAELHNASQIILNSIVNELMKLDGENKATKFPSHLGLMPLSAEILMSKGQRHFLSLCCYKQHHSGDLMKDPDVTFICHSSKAWVVEFQNDFIGRYDRVAEFDSELNVTVLDAEQAKSVGDFANSWLHQIRDFYTIQS